ncbi:GIY-YIG nuclease family protein [Blastococcus sp. DSM 46786]|uniref:GIY-YIG nuclease family protein n=1 Tax=Blastococcus sp. DSM 46786 TaxID=1798227 RepID=UPI001113E2CC|nr:GIY-YIG nuclease family protein [Blastococcus sp. DSM 46786]
MVGIDARLTFEVRHRISWNPRFRRYELSPELVAGPGVYRIVLWPNVFYVGEGKDLAARIRGHLRRKGSRTSPVRLALDRARAAGGDERDLGQVEVVSMTATADQLQPTADYELLEFVPVTRALLPDNVYTRLTIEGLALAVSVEMWPSGRCLNRLTRDGEGMRYLK